MQKYTKKQVIEKFGNIELKFSRYYKCSFTFTYEDKNVKITGFFGTSPDDVYRYEVTADTSILVKDHENKLHYLLIMEDDKEVFCYNDY